MSATHETLTCPYCGHSIPDHRDMRSLKEMSTHKARCPKKRYLGGELELGTAQDARHLLGLDN